MKVHISMTLPFTNKEISYKLLMDDTGPGHIRRPLCFDQGQEFLDYQMCRKEFEPL